MASKKYALGVGVGLAASTAFLAPGSQAKTQGALRASRAAQGPAATSTSSATLAAAAVVAASGAALARRPVQLGATALQARCGGV